MGPSNADEHLAAGARASAAGDWRTASECFEAALRDRQDAEGLAGLGEAVFWLGDITRAVELRERAYVAFRDGGDDASAARMAMWIAMQYSAGFGQPAVASGWLARAERLVAELGPCAERGWLLLRRSRGSTDPAAAAALANEALDVARAVDDRDLEIAAISQGGRALLSAGRIDEGFARLDEAMAAATSGEARHAETVGATCCDMIGACERAMEIERATQWCQVTDEYARRMNFLPIFAFCRVTYAAVLLSAGRWGDAEREIAEALHAYESSFRVQTHLALARLAELRILQGRDAEAEELAREHLQRPGFAKVVAMLHLARGEAPSAVRVLRKRLAEIEGDVLLSAPLLALLVEALVASGDVSGAAAAAEQVDRIAATTRRPAFDAAASYAGAVVACAREEPDAMGRFEVAVRGYAAIGMPLAAARARLGLARCLEATDRRAARDECRTALAVLEQLGARRDIDATAELRRRLGVGARIGARTSTVLTRREEEVLALLGLGLSNADIGRRLFISPKTVEHHVGHILAKLDVKTRAAAAAHGTRRTRKPAGGRTSGRK